MEFPLYDSPTMWRMLLEAERQRHERASHHLKAQLAEARRREEQAGEKIRLLEAQASCLYTCLRARVHAR